VHARERGSGGFSLLEVGIALAIIAILSVLALAGASQLRARAQRIKCANNLRNLAVAANLYLEQNGSWPQIRRNSVAEPQAYAQAWIDALTPFGATREIWICPTIQGLLNNPDYSTAETARVDYVATPFDDRPGSPREWVRQPWFIERGNVHGKGNLVIFTDGSVQDLKTVLNEAKKR